MYTSDNSKIDWLMVSLASPDQVLKRSNWAVEKPDTTNYRTGKPTLKWLFCESIFGPVKSYECSCGKYKWARYKWIVCEKCGVELTSSKVRRERMGHIELASPVVHIWYYKASPSRIWLLLDLTHTDIEKILYYVKYIVVNNVDDKKVKVITWELDKILAGRLKELDEVYNKELDLANKSDNAMSLKVLEKAYEENKSALSIEFNRISWIIKSLKKWSTILESDYRNFFYRYTDIFDMKSGAEAIQELLAYVNIEEEIQKVTEKFKNSKWEERKKIFKLLRLLINLHISEIRPEWMIIKQLPVIPPDLRPIVQLPWGKNATTDVNNFYRRVIQRNLRLKKMIQVGMPDIVKKNEIRLLQESVNNLIIWDKTTTGKTWGIGKNRVFKSLTDMLGGKRWIFRMNLLGKRVDYSARSVITVWPELKIDECGLPIYIAIRIFSPFVISKLLERQVCHTPRQAEKMIKEEAPVALQILQEVIKDKYVLLNRAPSLHRLSIQAFKIILMTGKTIRIHPLVCKAFNADFDGDNMAVHLPISEEAQAETKELISAKLNILKPASWEPIVSPEKDMILGTYYMTFIEDLENKSHMWFYNSEETVIIAYESNKLKINDVIMYKFEDQVIKTTVWRVIFNNQLPERIKFKNDTINSKVIKKILDETFDVYGPEIAMELADKIKSLWFIYATKSCLSANIFDMMTPATKQQHIWVWDERSKVIQTGRYRWFLSENEKSTLIQQNWLSVSKELQADLQHYYKTGNDFKTMVDSWARWSMGNLMQMSWIKWLVVWPSGRVIELPIKTSYTEWLSPLEYFISAHGARKWRADTALRTADAGYLTRRLCDSTQEVIVKVNDCNTEDYITVSRYDESYLDYINGRVAAEDIIWSTLNVIVAKGELIDKKSIQAIQSEWVELIKVRSPLNCNVVNWVCQKCFWTDLSTRKLIKIGTPIGIIASQSLWEPGTQLTMNTRHAGGAATEKWDIIGGIDRVNELLEARTPTRKAIVSPYDGKVSIHYVGKNIEIEIIWQSEKKMYYIKEELKIWVKLWEVVKKWTVIASKWTTKIKANEDWEVLEIKKDSITIWCKNVFKKELSSGTLPKVKDWQNVTKWQTLTSGLLDPRELQVILWDLAAQVYIVSEIERVYREQAQSINKKYIEIIVKQMFSKVLIEDSWDSTFIPGSIAKYEDFIKVNQKLEAENKLQSVWHRMIFGLTSIAKESDSRLSSASFQETVRTMVENSLKWSIDYLNDLKSNVILGRLLPIGKNFKWELEAEVSLAPEIL